MIKKTLLAVALMSAALYSIPAMAAEEVTLCAGSQGRKYDKVMTALGAELAQRGYSVTIKNLRGSEEILQQLDAGQCDYGPAQKDIHYMKNSAATPTVMLYNEVPTMVCTKESGIDELSDFTKDTTIIVDTVGSGTALTWDNMVAIEKEFGNKSSWSEAQAVYIPLDEAEAAVSIGQADCVMGVGGVPDGWAKEMEKNGGVISWLYDKDINDKVVGKTPLYTPVRVPYGPYLTKYDTYAIPAILFRGKNPQPKELDTLVKKFAPAIGRNFNTVKVN